MAGILGGSVVVAFGYLAGMGMSALRAIIMFLLMTISQMLGRSYDTATALAVAGISMLYENPGLIHYAGFVLSFAAVLGASVVNKIISGLNNRGRKGISAKLSQGLWMSIAIQLTTWPILAYYYYEISVYSVFLNVIMLPFLGLIIMSGMMAGIIGLYCIPGAKLIAIPAGVILKLYYNLGMWAQKLPGANLIVGKPTIGRIAMYYSLFFGILFLMYMWKRSMQNVAMILLVGIIVWPTPHPFEIDILDVGQGDGTYLCTSNGTGVFIDGGSTDTYQVGEYRILPFLKCKGVRKIDWWFISHADEDHISGFLEILESGYRVEHLVLSAYMPRDEAYEQICIAARKNHTELVFMKAGDRLKIGEATFSCLFPYVEQRNTLENKLKNPIKIVDTVDRNASSLTLLYEDTDFRGIFAGDLAEEQEKWIIRNYELPSVMLYKANHHGSKYSSGKEWLEELQPKVTTISCGAGNTYGHPGKEALERIQEAGSKCYLTMEAGQIRICKMQNQKMHVETFL